jgi:hypothetical protein
MTAVVTSIPMTNKERKEQYKERRRIMGEIEADMAMRKRADHEERMAPIRAQLKEHLQQATLNGRAK